jgi:hypothetical protein
MDLLKFGIMCRLLEQKIIILATERSYPETHHLGDLSIVGEIVLDLTIVNKSNVRTELRHFGLGYTNSRFL